MKFFSRLSYVMVAFLTVAFLSTAAHAQSNIGVIDLGQVIEKSSVGKDLQAKFMSRKNALQSEATNYEKELRSKEATLVADSKTMDKAAFAQKRDSFEASMKKKRQEILTRTVNLEKSKNGALKAIQDKIAQICASIAEAKNIQIIIDRESVVIAHQSLDITADVIRQLDASLKSVTLN